jgi:comEA protein
MSGRERLASAILIITVAIGVLATILQNERAGGLVPEAHFGHRSDCGDTACAFIKLDINKATAGELMALPGIGPKKADAVVDWRRSNGPFGNVEELVAVKGIGPKTLSRIRRYVCTAQGAVQVSE